MNELGGKLSRSLKGVCPELTICMPTFNRGRKALKSVQLMLQNGLNSSWQILVLNNGSSCEKKYYKDIEKISQYDNRIKYIEKITNTGFARNFLDCFKLSESTYLIFVADEDIVDSSGAAKILNILQSNPMLGAVRGSVAGLGGVFRGNSFTFEDQILESKSDRFHKFSLFNNYMSGCAYNREIVIEHNLIERVEKGLPNHEDYPHLYLSILVSAVAPVAISSIVLALEGESSDDEITYKDAYQLGRRFDQFVHLRDALHEAICLTSEDFDEILFINIYLLLCARYSQLICKLNAPTYFEKKIDVKYVGLALVPFFISGICKYSWSEKYMEQLTVKVKEAVEVVTNS